MIDKAVAEGLVSRASALASSLDRDRTRKRHARRMWSGPGGQSPHTLCARENIPSGFEAVAQHRGESLDVALVGELDMAATFKLESDLERLLATDTVRRLVLDLGGLTFIDSAGLGALLAIRDRTQDLGTEMVLTNTQAPVRRILDLSGLRPVLLD